MKYIYGPVPSRRLGLSLGLTLTPYKTCTFDCIYCQLGKTTVSAIQPQEYIPIKEILDELKSWLANNPEQTRQLNYITFSGSGEPTLNVKFGELISEIKKIMPVPVPVISNASLLDKPEVRQALLGADLIVPSLDAASPEVFRKIDRPHEGIKVEDVIEGLVSLRRQFRGKFWLEVMLVKGINDDLRHIKKLKEVIDRINPDKVQLNSPVRTTAEPNVLPVDKVKLNKIKEILGDKAEIV
ncbi:MAG: radical SAM protein [Candidatus Omnitrophica bacterium]|nr:radical SAM protein [Candidatus Omnitrophota bacterium]